MGRPASQVVLITGVSSGIGRALAEWYVEHGWNVHGVSRRTPGDLKGHDRFRFVNLDLSDTGHVVSGIHSLVGDICRLDVVILNAGVLGRFGDMSEVDLDDLTNTMLVNVWANKLVLDALFQRRISIGQVVAISSGASVSGNRGWSGYSISKAALNMLIRLYSRERPDTHFCALAPGLVDTKMLDGLFAREPDSRFPAIEALRSKRHTPDMPAPAEAAGLLAETIVRLPDLVESGVYADIRSLSS